MDEPPPSIPELPREKRDEDGSLEEDGLASKHVLAKDVKPKATSSVSKDDDSNRETRGGGGGVRRVDKAVVSNNNSSSSSVVVLKPTHEAVLVRPRDAASVPNPPYQMSTALQRSESMRTWKEMKQNGFLSGALGGPVASRPRRLNKKKRGDSTKIKTTNQVPDKKKKDQHVTNASPSGLLTGLKPGIIRHVRSKEQVYSVVEGLIRNAGLNVKDSARQDKTLASKLSDHDIPFTNPEQAKSLAVEAASVASQWLDFLHQDLSGRLSAVQESRNRVDDTLKAELPLVVSSTESSSANQKWSAKFEEYKKHLRDEEKDLEHSLNQVKDMQSRCNEGLRQMKEASCGKDGNNQEDTNMAVQAAAASILSTCRYLLSKMKEATA